MPIPPIIVMAARAGWHGQWTLLMGGLGPSDGEGNYQRPVSDHLQAVLPEQPPLHERPGERLPRLIVGRSCPWAHRTWLVHQLRGLENSLSLLMATADHEAGRWKLKPAWLAGTHSALITKSNTEQAQLFSDTADVQLQP